MKPNPALLAVSLALSLAAHGATRESFDPGWKFARFGPMPDGSQLDEPGTASTTIRASSEEGDKSAANAIDGKSDTRWCAADGSPNQSITLDLGRPGPIGSVEIDWEKAAVYPFKLETSADGAKWQLLSDQTHNTDAAGKSKVSATTTARYLRVTMGDTPATQWASIRELRVLDPQGKPIKPVPSNESSASTPASPDFNDSQWRGLNLPHDWAIEGPFRAELENETGKLPWPGIGWYRKSFQIPAEDKGKSIYLDFDGAMSRPKVYVNGKLAGEWAYGYSSFRIDITSFVKCGTANQVSVRLDNLPRSSRWYPGGGIYRHVWLVKANPVHFKHNSVFARGEGVSNNSATVLASAETEGPANTKGLAVTYQIIDAQGKLVAKATSADPAATLRIPVTKPTLWTPEKPYLYTLRATLGKDGAATDSEDISIGIRSAEWKPDGLYVNGTRIQIKGVCNHHDLGAIGTAFNERACQRQIEILKDMGCNAIRTSHNPPAPQLLDLCDRMGMLVLDELFDAWKLGKKPNDYHLSFDAWHEKDATEFARRDRNHPSVIAWSVGNEIPEQGHKDMHWIAKNLADLIRAQDPTRSITAGCNNLGSANNGFTSSLDIIGFNYPVRQPKLAAEIHAKQPTKSILGTETASCVSSRGCYYFPVTLKKSDGCFEFQVSSYELSAPGWANRPDLDFELLDRNPFVAGEFVWTGFDYFGEPTPYNNDSTNALNFQNPEERKAAMEELKKLGGKAPSRSSYFGIIDLCGFPKDRFYLYQAHWRPDFPMAHILPHWNWPERVGQVTPVHVFTSGDEAELFLNGKSLGRKKKDAFSYRITWDDVTYQPGELKVIAYKNGRKWAEDDRSTTGAATKLIATADRAEIKADGKDLSYITVTVADAKGRLVPRSMNRLNFKIEGDAEIVAVCNGDAASLASLHGDSLPAFNGLCQVVVRGKSGKPGAATLSISSDGLSAAKVAVTTR